MNEKTPIVDETPRWSVCRHERIMSMWSQQLPSKRCLFFILLYILKGHRIVQLPIRFGTRSLCTAHTLRTPEVTSQNFSDKFNPRYAQEDEEDEYEIDDDELEKLRQQHREEARTQHKAKEG